MCAELKRERERGGGENGETKQKIDDNFACIIKKFFFDKRFVFVFLIL